MYLATSAQIKRLDASASEQYGIPEIQLMANGRFPIQPLRCFAVRATTVVMGLWSHDS